MDLTAISLCRENKVPICVFNIYNENALNKVINRKNSGSIICGENYEF